MTARDNAGLFQNGIDILGSSVSTATNKILLQTGRNIGEGQTEADNVVMLQQPGFASRPADPIKGKAAAQAFVIRQGGQDVAIGAQDLRGLELYGQLKPGETCIYATGDGNAQPRILLKADGSINLFTKEGNVAGGAGMGIFVNADGSISITSHTGAALLIGTDGSIKIFNGSGSVQVTDDGSIKLASPAKVEISGASITLGGPTAQPLALAVALLAVIDALQVQITAQATAWAALGALTGPILGVMLQPIAAPIAAATVVGVAATAAAHAAVPTKRVIGD